MAVKRGSGSDEVGWQVFACSARPSASAAVGEREGVCVNIFDENPFTSHTAQKAQEISGVKYTT
jgi:hypothetical protein